MGSKLFKGEKHNCAREQIIREQYTKKYGLDVESSIVDGNIEDFQIYTPYKQLSDEF